MNKRKNNNQREEINDELESIIIPGSEEKTPWLSSQAKKIILSTTAGVLFVLSLSQMMQRPLDKKEKQEIIPTLPPKPTPKKTPKPTMRLVEPESNEKLTTKKWAVFQNAQGRPILFHESFWEDMPEGQNSIPKKFKDLIPTPNIEVTTTYTGRGENQKMHLECHGQTFLIQREGQGFVVLRGKDKLKEVYAKATLKTPNTIDFRSNEEQLSVPKLPSAQLGTLDSSEVAEIVIHLSNTLEVLINRDQTGIKSLVFQDKATKRIFETTHTNGFTFITKETGGEGIYQTTLAKVGASYTTTPSGKSYTPSDETTSFLTRGGDKWTAARVHMERVIKSEISGK